MIAVDTNFLLRFLLKPIDGNNPKWQVDTAEATINQAEKVFIANIVLSETERVLESVFASTREQIHALIHALAGHTQLRFEDWAAFKQCLVGLS